MKFLYITGVENELQDEVNETIETLKRAINNLRDLRTQTIKSDDFNEEQLYYLQEGFREGLAASAISLAGIIDSYISEEYGHEYPIGMVSRLEDEWWHTHTDDNGDKGTAHRW